ncbi:MAG TPA: hypothetical protein P5110_01125 [Candidatus Omnitrophota bacterium]|nr:hypothetical protein [Candidatus Omnitrophota bacterium]HRZ14087.1 hypothetical protein [Candidatus Omnitrophota bacterium]
MNTILKIALCCALAVGWELSGCRVFVFGEPSPVNPPGTFKPGFAANKRIPAAPVSGKLTPVNNTPSGGSVAAESSDGAVASAQDIPTFQMKEMYQRNWESFQQQKAEYKLWANKEYAQPQNEPASSNEFANMTGAQVYSDAYNSLLGAMAQLGKAITVEKSACSGEDIKRILADTNKTISLGQLEEAIKLTNDRHSAAQVSTVQSAGTSATIYYGYEPGVDLKIVYAGNEVLEIDL